MKAILIIDHGSVRAEANAMLDCMAELVQRLVGDGVVVEAAHMELADPDIAAGFARCVERGATEVIAFPYMLSPGRHSTGDIPNLVERAAADHPHVSHRTTSAFGVHRHLAELILERSGVEQVTVLDEADSCRCWEPEGIVATCGAACPARIVQAPADSTTRVSA